MRSFVFAIIAAALLLPAAAFAAPPATKLGDRAPLVAAQPVKLLRAGERAQGTLSRVDAVAKHLEMQTAEGLVRVPLTAKLQVQNGLNGTPVNTTLDDVQQVAAKRVIVIIIRTKDTIIIIIIRTRS